MERAEVITSVAADLTATERAIDTALTQATTLIQSMIGARAALSLSPVAGAGSQTKAMETLAALGAAREAIVACHAELQKDHRRLGFGVYNVGPLDKPDDWAGVEPQSDAAQATTRHLRAV